ncbi:g10767 [Coccomyxa elongata]
MASSLFQTVHCPAPFVSKQHFKRRSVAVSTPCRRPTVCANQVHDTLGVPETLLRKGSSVLLSLAAAFAVSAAPAMAEIRLPPIDNDPNRCERAYTGNTIGQANAVSDRVLDLRMCDFTGKDLSGKTLSGALLKDAVLPNANLREAVLSKAYAVGANLSGVDMTNAVVDRVDFRKANLSNVKFYNAVITGTTFEGANLDGAEFEGALIGNEDVKRLCLNPTLTGESRMGVGCRMK